MAPGADFHPHQARRQPPDPAARRRRHQAAAIHGNKSQAARVKALDMFKRGQVTALVATEVAARGLDIKELPHVVNYELPNVPEDYVHRIGRTGRAGAAGQAVSLVSSDETGLAARHRAGSAAQHPGRRDTGVQDRWSRVAGGRRAIGQRAGADDLRAAQRRSRRDRAAARRRPPRLSAHGIRKAVAAARCRRGRAFRQRSR